MSGNFSRNITSGKVLLSLATAASVAFASLTPGLSYARGFIGGRPFMGGHLGGAGAGLGPSPTGRHSGRSILVPMHPRPSGHPTIPVHLKPGRPIVPIPIPVPPPHHHHHHHHHWVFRDGHWIVVDEIIVGEDAVSEDAVGQAPAPCNCLTKTYTPTGLVVFADICTKESASAVALSDHADAAQAPTTDMPAKVTPMSEVPTVPDYAGRTYQDYLVANPQAAPPQAADEQPRQSQRAPGMQSN